MFSISTQNLSFIDDDYKELSLSKKFDFKTKAETLDTWNSLDTYPNHMKLLSHIYSFMIYKIPRMQIQKCSNKGDMTKKLDLTQSFQKLITLTKHIIFFWNFENKSFLWSFIIFPSFTPRFFHSRFRSRFKDLTSITLDMLISSHLFFKNFLSFHILSFPCFSFALNKLL